MLQEKAGELAGKIWHYLDKNSESDYVKIKLDLNINNTELFIAIGWLLRENKITLRYAKDIYYISLI